MSFDQTVRNLLESDFDRELKRIASEYKKRKKKKTCVKCRLAFRDIVIKLSEGPKNDEP